MCEGRAVSETDLSVKRVVGSLNVVEKAKVCVTGWVLVAVCS